MEMNATVDGRGIDARDRDGITREMVSRGTGGWTGAKATFGLCRSTSRRSASILGIALIFGFCSAPAASAAGVEKDAKEILRSMSDYLGGLKAFSADADVDNEVVDQQGQKLHLNSSASFVVQRPGNLYMHRLGGAGEVELLFDGKTVTIHGMRGSIYMQIDTPGDLGQALQNTRIETGIDFPGADLLFSDPYDALMYGVVSGAYLGSGYVNGIECHHLAFRSAQVDWQIWIQTGDVPLPMKYVITTKWVTAAPQYVARFRNWNTKPKIESKRFDFTPKQGAKKLDSIPVSATGDVAAEGM